MSRLEAMRERLSYRKVIRDLRRSVQRRVPLSRKLARWLSVLFAFVGAVPLVLFALARTDSAQRWAARTTQRVLQSQFGIKASFTSSLQTFPFALVVDDLIVPSSNPSSAPALKVAHVSIQPSFFSLLQGKFVVRDIVVKKARVVLEFKDGQLTNLKLDTSSSQPDSSGNSAPFRVISFDDLSTDITVDGQRVEAEGIDLDVTAESDGSFEVLTRVASVGTTYRTYFDPDEPSSHCETEKVFEDRLCDLDLQVKIQPSGLLIRRFHVTGSADFDPSFGTRPSCRVDDDEHHALDVGAHMVSVRLEDKTLAAVSGELQVSAPLALARRWVSLPALSGWVQMEAEGRWARGEKLPSVRASVRGAGLRVGVFRLAKTLDARVSLSPSRGLEVPSARVGFADAMVHVEQAHVGVLDPKVPISANRVTVKGLQFPGLMRDLGVTEHTVVQMDVTRALLTNVHGTLSPVHIDSSLDAKLRDFEVFDNSFDNPARKHVIGVHEAHVKSILAVRSNGLEFQQGLAQFGSSSLRVFTHLGFDNRFGLRVSKGSRLNLKDISPLMDLPWTGESEVEVRIDGVYSDPTIRGKLKMKGFSFANMAFGDILTADALFHDMAIRLTEVQARKGKSRYAVPKMLIDFRGPASVLALADVSVTRFALQDFFKVFHLDTDPRYSDIHGVAQATASVRFEQGGPHDRCGGGSLRVRARGSAPTLQVAGEDFQDGRFDLDLDWFDLKANQLGMRLDVRSFTARKGTGTIVGKANINPGGVLSASVAATDVPLDSVQSLSILGPGLGGTASGWAQVFGTIDHPEADMSVTISPVRLGSARYGPSKLRVRLTPTSRPARLIGRTACGHGIPGAFDRQTYDKDMPQGLFHIEGTLFGGQIELQPLVVTWQRRESLSGVVQFRDFRFGQLVASAGTDGDVFTEVSGAMSADVRINTYSRWAPQNTDMSVSMSSLNFGTDSVAVALQRPSQPIVLKNDELTVPLMRLNVRPTAKPAFDTTIHGAVRKLTSSPRFDMHASLLPTDLSVFESMSPSISQVKGKLDAHVDISGSLFHPRMSGRLRISDGSLLLSAIPTPIHDIDVEVALHDDSLRIAKASARMGGGSVSLTGSMPLRGFEPGVASIRLDAKHVGFSLERGIDTTVDAELVAHWNPLAGAGRDASVDIGGRVDLLSVQYLRPFSLSTDLAGALSEGRAAKRFEVYDPAGDFLRLNVLVTNSHPLVIRNDLADMKLDIVEPGLVVQGSNQRIGVLGSLRILRNSTIQLRNNEFEVKHGFIRFDDPTRIRPFVDLTAVTEYRRYAQSQPSSTEAGTSAGHEAGAGHAGGFWRIEMHAHGSTDELGLDLSSEPALSQEDIVLLLTMGVTRAEMDRLHASALGESAALEALSSLTGAGASVTEVVPVIDDVRFGTAYSARSGRSEPTITVGKRVTDRVRASVTTGLSDNQEVRSNVEWKFTSKTSILGSYDNVNNVSNSSLGNVGADIRFRLVFE